MQVSKANDVKIYNLSYGKSIPEWMSSVARRKLEKGNIDVRRRIQLIQDFEMPDMSNTINFSPDGRYVFATGNYKPVVKCYDLNDLSMKFERGIDTEIHKLIVISDDYSKFIMLQDERYIEFHAAFGRYFRMRMPKYGRDMAFSRECSDLYLCGTGDEIYRLNLEQGEWLTPLVSGSKGINCCKFAEQHQLFVCGTSSGVVEAWDQRDKNRLGLLNVSSCLSEYNNGNISEITSISFKDALHLAVGTSTGQVVLYDIRSSRPLLVKDHYNELPIIKIDYVKRDEGDLILSLDNRVLKMWNEEDGSAFSAIESDNKLVDFNRYPDSGLIFFANEAPRMLQYFVPSLGQAPKWCSFLETITEELEESEQQTVYDDYKFVTKQQLEDVGLAHLIGTTVLRAYMHGYFINAKLYAKAQTLTQPFAFKNYKDRKIRDIMDKERETNIVKAKKDNLPKVNKELALRLQGSAAASKKKGKKETSAAILSDDRFKQLFQSSDFQVDEESEEFKRRVGQRKVVAQPVDNENDSDVESEPEESEGMELSLPNYDDENRNDNNMDSDLDSDYGHDEDDSAKALAAKEKMKRMKERKERQREKFLRDKAAEKAERERRQENKPTKFVLHEITPGESSKKFLDDAVIEDKKASVAMFKRKLAENKKSMKENITEDAFGGKSMTFTLEKTGKDGRAAKEKQERKNHQKERKEVVRATTDAIARKLKKLPRNIGAVKKL